MCLAEISAVGKVERRIEVEIAKQHEVSADRYLMLHTVLPIL